MFTIHYKMMGRLITSHIRYDGFEAEERRFSIVFDNNEVKCAASWSQLLFDVFEVKPEDTVFSPSSQLPGLKGRRVGSPEKRSRAVPKRTS
jgi:hypothetical protein